MLKTIKPDANGAFPIINDDLDSKIIVVVDEYNEERLPVLYLIAYMNTWNGKQEPFPCRGNHGYL
jgi:hypothetical protein